MKRYKLDNFSKYYMNEHHQVIKKVDGKAMKLYEDKYYTLFNDDSVRTKVTKEALIQHNLGIGKVENLPGEEWAVFLEGNRYIYEVSNKGRLKIQGSYKCLERIKSPALSRDGYYRIVVKDSKVNLSLHREVAKNFLDKEPHQTDVHHIDGNKLNCTVDNLVWCTHKENINYDRNIGGFNKLKEYTMSTRKFTFKEAETIRVLYKSGKYNQRELANMYNTYPVKISMIVTNKIYKREHI